MNITKQTATAVILAGALAASLSAQGIAAKIDPNRTDECQRTVLDMQVENNEIRVTGGNAGDPVALLLGLETASIPVGKAELKIMPLVILAMGSFDESGEYRWRLADNANGEPVSVLLQAISADERGCWSTSEAWQVDYHGGAEFTGQELPAENQDVARMEVGIRRYSFA